MGAPTFELILNVLEGNLITVVTMTTGSDGCSSKWMGDNASPGNKAMSGHRGAPVGKMHIHQPVSWHQKTPIYL